MASQMKGSDGVPTHVTRSGFGMTQLSRRISGALVLNISVPSKLVERNFRVGILQSEIRLRFGFAEIITFFGCNSHATRLYWDVRLNSGRRNESGASIRCPFLDREGKPLPDHIQRVLDELVPRLRRKFPVIRDEVVFTQILEEAGQQIVNREQGQTPIEHLYGFA